MTKVEAISILVVIGTYLYILAFYKMRQKKKLLKVEKLNNKQLN